MKRFKMLILLYILLLICLSTISCSNDIEGIKVISKYKSNSSKDIIKNDSKELNNQSKDENINMKDKNDLDDNGANEVSDITNNEITSQIKEEERDICIKVLENFYFSYKQLVNDNNHDFLIIDDFLYNDDTLIMSVHNDISKLQNKDSKIYDIFYAINNLEYYNNTWYIDIEETTVFENKKTQQLKKLYTIVNYNNKYCINNIKII